MLTEDTLLVMVYQSGQSGEITELCSLLPEAQPMIAVTNNGDCALAKRASLVLLMHVAPEDIVSTRSYLSSQILMYLFAQAYLGAEKEKLLEDLRHSLVYLGQAVDAFDEICSYSLQTPPFLLSCFPLKLASANGFSISARSAFALSALISLFIS